jgi:hypothetical protein
VWFNLVIAPIGMQEGYEFEVEFNGQTLIAVVVSGLFYQVEALFFSCIKTSLIYLDTLNYCP